MGANLHGANLTGTILSSTIGGISQEQLNSALGDDTTKIPKGLTRPDVWSQWPPRAVRAGCHPSGFDH